MVDITALSTYPFCLSYMSYFQIMINQFLQFFGRDPYDFGTAVCDCLDFLNVVNP